MSKKYEEPTKLQLELMINKGMGIKDIQKETHKQFTEIKKLLDQYGLNIEDKRKKYMSRKRTTITPTKVPEKRDLSEIHDRYATVPKLELGSNLTQLHIEQENGVELVGSMSDKQHICSQEPITDGIVKAVAPVILGMIRTSDEKKESENMESNKVTVSGSIPMKKEDSLILNEYVGTDKTKELEKYLAKNKDEDVVNHPNHYCQGGHECIDEMLLVFGVEAVKHFCLLNVWKYRKRALFKNGQQDIEKSDWYMNKYFELSEQE